jgi:hypothetical protein
VTAKADGLDAECAPERHAPCQIKGVRAATRYCPLGLIEPPPELVDPPLPLGAWLDDLPLGATVAMTV